MFETSTGQHCTRLRSSSSLIVSRTRLSTVGDRAFPVAAACVWDSLPDLVTSAPSLAVSRSRLKTHLFNISYPSPLWLYSARAVTLSCFGHYNRSYLLFLTYRQLKTVIYYKYTDIHKPTPNSLLLLCKICGNSTFTYLIKALKEV